MDFNERVIYRGVGMAKGTNMGCRSQRLAAPGNYGHPDLGRLLIRLCRLTGFLR